MCVVCTIKYRRVGVRRQWVDFLGESRKELGGILRERWRRIRAVWVRVFAVCLWIFYGFFTENGVFLYGRNGVIGSLGLERAYERREFEQACVSGCGVAGCSCAVRDSRAGAVYVWQRSRTGAG